MLLCAGRPWQLVDELVTDVASPHTRNLLQQYRKESQVGPLRALMHPDRERSYFYPTVSQRAVHSRCCGVL